MTYIHFNNINKAGLDDTVIAKYQQTPKVIQMIKDIKSGHDMPPIELYPIIKYKLQKPIYTIADGIHRICAYIYLGIYRFECKIRS